MPLNFPTAVTTLGLHACGCPALAVLCPEMDEASLHNWPNPPLASEAQLDQLRLHFPGPGGSGLTAVYYLVFMTASGEC